MTLHINNLARYWNNITRTKYDHKMKQKINVLVVEDNEYYNNLIFNALQQSTHFFRQEENYELILHSFINSHDFMRSIDSREFRDNDIIAFVDHNMGNGITGAQIIGQMRKRNNNTLAVLLSQSKIVEEKNAPDNHDFFVVKDTFAPALCRLYLDQYIENKFL